MSSVASSSSASSSSSSRRSTRRSRSVFKPSGVSIPDMRFEQSYLASIRSLIHEVNSEDAADELKQESMQSHYTREKENEKMDASVADVLDAGLSASNNGEKREENSEKAPPKVLATRSPAGEPELWLGRLRIEWWSLLYLTVRDQILSPVIQGAVFAVGGIALGHVRALVVARRQMAREQAAQPISSQASTSSAPFSRLRESINRR